MIRLLEFSKLGIFQAWIFEKASKVDPGLDNAPE
jgi:hypothetical protein